jgi:hypothetical protein
MRPAQGGCDQRQPRPTNSEVQTQKPKVGGSSPPSDTQNAVHRWSVNELAAVPDSWAVVWVPGLGGVPAWLGPCALEVSRVFVPALASLTR